MHSLINNMYNMCVFGPEPTSVILSHTQYLNDENKEFTTRPYGPYS